MFNNNAILETINFRIAFSLIKKVSIHLCYEYSLCAGVHKGFTQNISKTGFKHGILYSLPCLKRVSGHFSKFMLSYGCDIQAEAKWEKLTHILK